MWKVVVADYLRRNRPLQAALDLLQNGLKFPSRDATNRKVLREIHLPEAQLKPRDLLYFINRWKNTIRLICP